MLQVGFAHAFLDFSPLRIHSLVGTYRLTKPEDICRKNGRKFLICSHCTQRSLNLKREGGRENLDNFFPKYYLAGIHLKFSFKSS